MTIIAPSILAANLANLEKEVRNVAAAGADWIHFDVMDGHFVPPITFGSNIASAVRSITSLPIDVHLMVTRPEDQIEQFAAAGATSITIQLEATAHSHRLTQKIRELGLKSGVAINPGTSLSAVEEILPHIDLLLLMTVNPGWGGQHFISSSVNKIRKAAAMIKSTGSHIHLQVDGGINKETAAVVTEAGATVLVAGTAVFGAEDYGKAIRELRG